METPTLIDALTAAYEKLRVHRRRYLQIDPDVARMIMGDWRTQTRRELTEDDKAIHRAIEHHQP